MERGASQPVGRGASGEEHPVAHDLTGKHVAILIAPKGTEHVEFAEPKKAVEGAGGRTSVVGSRRGEAKTVRHDLEPGENVTVDAAFSEVSAEDFDAVVIPGGTVGADKLRADEDAVAFVRGFFERGKPVAAICHGPWLLVEADVLRDRTITSYPSLQTDIRNAGGTWVDREVHVDQGLVTSRKPDDLPAFTTKLIEEIAEGKHEAQARSV
jgi:protease I